MLIATCALVGCGGSARSITRDERGGLFALEGSSGDARADAERQMTAHCGAGGHRVTFEGDVDVLEEETHERTLEDRTAQTRTLQSSDHTSWVEGTSPYAESGVSLPLEGGGPQLYSSDRGARARTTRMRSERHLEYECEGESASTSTSASTSASPSASP